MEKDDTPPLLGLRFPVQTFPAGNVNKAQGFMSTMFPPGNMAVPGGNTRQVEQQGQGYGSR